MKSGSSATSDTLDMVPRHAFEDMIVSVARHKTSIGDSKFTYQFPLSALASHVSGGTHLLNNPSFAQFNSIVERGLGISRSEMSVVWCLTESGQLAVINDLDSLCAAVLDHQNAFQSIVQLYAVKNSG